MRRRHPWGRPWVPFTVAAVIVLASLLVVASRNVMRRDLVLRVLNQEAVFLLRGPTQVCEGPLTPSASTQGAAIWGHSVIGPARVRVDVEDVRSSRTLATGQVSTTSDREHVVHLDRSVPAGRQVSVCLTSELNTVEVLGGPAVDPHVVMTGPRRGLNFSLSLLNNRHSLIGSLPTAFSRASLFKPSWVGSSTFWLLTAALLATFGLAGVAIASATADDQAGDPGASADVGSDRCASADGD